ncbi:hypothetical protein JAO29_02820 [Edaphobacter sp. HDX4]|uniref:hypothetical protein n=1 Tax=Edaphobacter sp. HDX4 TaxID=2794064 RepID=UPI002FE68156
MHGRPQVRVVSGVADDALLLREPDQQREETNIGRAVREEESARLKTARPGPRDRPR